MPSNFRSFRELQGERLTRQASGPSDQTSFTSRFGVGRIVGSLLTPSGGYERQGLALDNEFRISHCSSHEASVVRSRAPKVHDHDSLGNPHPYAVTQTRRISRDGNSINPDYGRREQLRDIDEQQDAIRAEIDLRSRADPREAQEAQRTRSAYNGVRVAASRHMHDRHHRNRNQNHHADHGTHSHHGNSCGGSYSAQTPEATCSRHYPFDDLQSDILIPASLNTYHEVSHHFESTFLLDRSGRWISDVTDFHSNSDSDDSDAEWEPMSAFNDPGFMATGHLIDTTQHTIAAPNPPENEKCGICLEGKEGGLLRKPHTCNHLFHAGCLDEWANSTNDNAHKCPVCRIEFTPEHRPFVARPLTGGQDDSENYGNNDDWLGGHNHQNRRPSSEYNR